MIEASEVFLQVVFAKRAGFDGFCLIQVGIPELTLGKVFTVLNNGLSSLIAVEILTLEGFRDVGLKVDAFCSVIGTKPIFLEVDRVF